MYKGKKIGVVVPAYNEERLVGRVLKTMPDFVDWIIVVDDCSQDGTSEVVEGFRDPHPLGEKLVLIRHEMNQGVGAAIVTGYKWARDNQIDITAVMAGDAQMHPADLPCLLDPVVDDEADYAKGNRLSSGEAWKVIPKHRYLGNAILSLLTKIASGYWHVADSQSGYTAVSLKVLEALDLDRIYKRYGVPNDFLVKLNVHSFRVRDVPIRPVYRIGEQSGIRLWKFIPKLSFLLAKCFLWRMKEKYVIRDFHPLIFFYGLAISLLVLSVPLFLRLIVVTLSEGSIPKINSLALMFSVITGLQSSFFAMWFDMEYSRHLK